VQFLLYRSLLFHAFDSHTNGVGLF
jgi:hypothetical protein